MANDPLRDRLAHEVNFVRHMYSPERKKQIVQDTLAIYRAMGQPVPLFLDRLINDCEYKMDLAHSREFCAMAGIVYNNIDDEWDNLRAGVARFYMAAALMLRKGSKRAA